MTHDFKAALDDMDNEELSFEGWYNAYAGELRTALELAIKAQVNPITQIEQASEHIQEQRRIVTLAADMLMSGAHTLQHQYDHATKATAETGEEFTAFWSKAVLSTIADFKRWEKELRENNAPQPAPKAGL